MIWFGISKLRKKKHPEFAMAVIQQSFISGLVYMVKIRSVPEIIMFDLKMIVKSGQDFFQSLYAGRKCFSFLLENF